MKTQGEIEAAICDGMARFQLEYMRRGPRDRHAYLIGDLLVVRLHGVLTAAEQQLIKSLPAEKGRDLLKEVRTHLIETARPLMEAMVCEVTSAKVSSLRYDISTTPGEEVGLFTLAVSPAYIQLLTSAPEMHLLASGGLSCPRFDPLETRRERTGAMTCPARQRGVPGARPVSSQDGSVFPASGERGESSPRFRISNQNRWRVFYLSSRGDDSPRSPMRDSFNAQRSVRNHRGQESGIGVDETPIRTKQLAADRS